MAMFGSARAARATWAYLVRPIPGGIDSSLTVDELTAFTIRLTGALVANVNVTFPAHATEDIGQVWNVENGTAGAFTVTVGNTTGAGVQIAQGKSKLVWWNGTDFKDVLSDLTGLAAASGANADITALTGITAGIAMAGGLLLAGGLGGNPGSPDAFRFMTTSVDMANGNKTLIPAEYSAPVIVCTSAPVLTADRNLVLPNNGFWIVTNSGGAAFNINAKTAAGTGVLIANTKTAIVRADGVNVVRVTLDA